MCSAGSSPLVDAQGGKGLVSWVCSHQRAGAWRCQALPADRALTAVRTGVAAPPRSHSSPAANRSLCTTAGEEVLRKSGLPYTVVRPGGLTDDPAGQAQLAVAQGDKSSGRVARADVAAVAVAALAGECRGLGCLRRGDRHPR